MINPILDIRPNQAGNREYAWTKYWKAYPSKIQGFCKYELIYYGLYSEREKNHDNR